VKTMGVGIDLVEIPRLERAMSRWGERLCRRLFTDEERESCSARPRPGQCLAASLAAKEAFFKAMGTGRSRGMAWREVEVKREKGSPPAIRIMGRTWELFRAMGMERIWLSISHEGSLSVAMVVIEGQGRGTPGARGPARRGI